MASSFAELLAQRGGSTSTGEGGDEIFKQLREVERLKERARDIGVEEELLTPRESLFSKVLNTIDKPKQIVQGVLDSALVRQDLAEIGLLGAARRGLDERINAFDILRRETDLSPVARGVIGFGAEVLSDPLTYLTFGTSRLAKAGGGALTAKGSSRLASVTDDILRRAAAEGGDSALFTSFTTASKKADDVFRAGREYMRLAKKGEGAIDSLQASKLANLRSTFDGFLNIEELPDLFAKQQISAGINLPFLGHFQKPTAQVIKKGGADAFDATAAALAKKHGIRAKILPTIGKVVKPGKLNIGTVEISDDIVDGYNSFKAIASENLDALGKQVDEAIAFAKETPGLRSIGTAADISKTLVGGVRKAYVKAFMQNGLGQESRGLQSHLANEVGGAAAVGAGTLARTFDGIADDATDGLKWVTDPANAELLTRAGRSIDGMFGESISELAGNLGQDGSEKLLKYIENVRRDPNFPLPDPDMWRGLEDSFIAKLTRYANDPATDKLEQEVVRRTISAFDELRRRELFHGIDTGLVESYIPHMYTNLDEVGRGSKISGGVKAGKQVGKPASFQITRKYNTLDDALSAGLQANTHVGELLLSRAMKSHVAIAKKQYAQSMAVLHGLPADKVREMWEVARHNPDSTEAQILLKNNLPTNIIREPEAILDLIRRDTQNFTEKLMREGALEELDAATGAFRIAKGTKAGLTDVIKDPDIRAVLQRVGEISPELKHNITRKLIENQQATLSQLETIFGRTDAPRSAFGEMGARLLKDANGKEYYVPDAVGQAMDEVLARKDLLREMFKGSELGEKFVDAVDGVTSTFKRWVTLPWPAYWSQNTIGDNLLRVADGGIMALDPNLGVRTIGLMNDQMSVRLANGALLDGKSFKEILQKHSIALRAKDTIDVLEATGKMDLDKLAKQQRGFLKNLKNVDITPALDSAADQMKNLFENYYRAQHVLHHLERGSSVAEAVTGAQKALINYRDLTDVERSLFRRFFYFYGWIQGSTRNTLHNLFTRPGALQAQLKSAQSLAEFFSDPNAAPSVEEFDKRTLQSLTEAEQVAFSLGRDAEGQRIVGRGFGLPLNTPLAQFSVEVPRNLSVSEIIGAAADSTTRTLQKQFAAANPLISGAAELVTGRNLFFDRPWDEAFLRKVPSMAAIAERIGGSKYTEVPASLVDDFTREWLGGVEDGKGNLVVDPGKFWVLTHIIPGVSRLISQARAFSDTRLTDSQSLLKTLSGVRVETADPERNFLFAQEEDLRKTLKRRSETLRKQQGISL